MYKKKIWSINSFVIQSVEQKKLSISDSLLPHVTHFLSNLGTLADIFIVGRNGWSRPLFLCFFQSDVTLFSIVATLVHVVELSCSRAWHESWWRSKSDISLSEDVDEIYLWTGLRKFWCLLPAEHTSESSEESNKSMLSLITRDNFVSLSPNDLFDQISFIKLVG